MTGAWIAEDDAAALVGCSVGTLRVGAARNRLVCVRSPFNGVRQYDAGEIDRLARLVQREIVRQSR